jgi:hypothetical protein
LPHFILCTGLLTWALSGRIFSPLSMTEFPPCLYVHVDVLTAPTSAATDADDEDGTWWWW